MQRGANTATNGELTCASFFQIPPHLAPTPQTRDASDNPPTEYRNGEVLDKNQKATQALLNDEADSDIPTSVSSPVFIDPFFGSPPPPQALQRAPTLPQPADTSSSPAAMWLSSFMAPKVEPKPLEDEEGSAVGGYTLGPVVGFGGFSTIRKAFSTSGGIVAIKIIRRADLVRTGHAPHERKKLEHEAVVWSSLSHEHILPLFSTVHTSYADYFITLYCPAGSLYDILKRDGNPALPQDDAGMMFRQVVRGLRYLHEDAMLVHRDMKLENVLVDESGVCRIGDFGLSVKIGQGSVDEDDIKEDEHRHQHEAAAGYNAVHRAFSMSLPKRPHKAASSLNPIVRHNSAKQRSATAPHTPPHIHQPGSLPYASPELLLPQSSEIFLPHPSQDIWALGVMLYALLAGHLPFKDSFEPRLQMKIMNGAFDLPKDIGRGAERILLGCIERSVPKRWTIAMVDEVAWGVGWGAAGDGATPEVEDEVFFSPTDDGDLEDYQPHNVVDSVIQDDEDEDDWQHEERNSRAAMEATIRRSRSRAQRSVSRAPILPRSNSGRSVSRHRASRPPSPGPRSALSASTSAFFSHSGSEFDHDSFHSPLVSPPYYDTPPRSRSASMPRGRKPNKRRSYYHSRSPSPSVVPTTPVDFGSHLMARMHLEDHPEELELDPPPRGRSTYVPSGFQDDDTVDHGHLAPHSDTEGDLESKPAQASVPTLISSRYSSSASGSSSRDTSADYFSLKPVPKIDRDATLRLSSRSGSVPPVSGLLQGLWAGAVCPSNELTPLSGGKGAPSPAMISRSRSAEDPKPLPTAIEVGAGAD